MKAAICAILISCACQVQATSDISLERIALREIPFDFGGKLLGVWSNGALILVDEENSGTPVFLGFNQHAEQVFRSRLSIPGAGKVELRWGGFARAPDGSVVACGSAYSRDALGASFIAWLSENGTEQRILQLPAFAPHKIGVGSDGTVWAVGRDKDSSRIVMRRYDNQGSLLGVTDLVADGSTDGRLHALYHSYIVTSADRVGWFSAGARQYIEFDLKGTVLRRVASEAFRSDQRLSGAGLSDNGNLFIGTRRVAETGAKGWEISFLDRLTGHWRKITRPEPWGYIYGSDGDALVVSTSTGAIEWLMPSRDLSEASVKE